jgi:predicted TIM-barrel fold metal-dependent hydrolase
MQIELFDVQAGILGTPVGTRNTKSAADLVETLQRFGISRALVRTATIDWDQDVLYSNEKLYAACEPYPQFVPCPMVVPNTGNDFPDETEQIQVARQHGAGVVRICPKTHQWLLEEWNSGELFAALEALQMPAYLAASQFSHPEVAQLAAKYPALAFILAEIGYREQRILLPLLKKFPNIFLSLGNRYTLHGGIEQFVREIGAGRLLFGTGYPESEPMSAIMQLLYADISERDKQEIGTINLSRLIERGRI